MKSKDIVRAWAILLPKKNRVESVFSDTDVPLPTFTHLRAAKRYIAKQLYSGVKWRLRRVTIRTEGE